MRPLVISHAACAGHGPENTLAGIRIALSLGADAVEIDIRASADGIPILMHDPTVDRTTRGSGPVAELTLDQLRTLDAGGEGVPTLAEALALTVGNALLIAEIKQPGIEQQVAAVIRKAGALDDIVVWSFFTQALEAMRRAEPCLPAALLAAPPGGMSDWPHLREGALRLGLQGLSLFHLGITEGTIRQARRSALALYTWTVDEEAEMRRLAELGVDGIVTNYPDRALACFSGRQPVA